MPSNAPRPANAQHVIPPVSVTQSAPGTSAQAQIPPQIPGQMPPMQAGQNQPRIKTEPGTAPQPPMPPMNPMQMNTNPHAARDRAISNIQQKYGNSAAHSVSQLQAQGQHGYPQMQAPSNGQGPQIKQEPGYPSLGNGQTDGGGEDPLTDWKAEVARRREAAQNGEGDRMLREYLNQKMSGLEAGGLLRPMNEHKTPSAASRRATRAAREAEAVPESSSRSVPRIPGQVDGGEEEDEDAINSDLDDPDDLVGDDQDAEEGDGQVMLCTYDKVQRVKNKWKCTLKDGILTSGGKEYVPFARSHSYVQGLLTQSDTYSTKAKANSNGKRISSLVSYLLFDRPTFTRSLITPV